MMTDMHLRTRTQPHVTVEPPRLLKRPAFILSTVRSGSTLLRCLLNSHTMLCAPSELHLRDLQVHLGERYCDVAMHTQGFDARELEYLLWDRLLAHILTRSGKVHLVEKSPSNLKIWHRLVECWPDAKFIVLRRNPAAIVASIQSHGHTESRAVTVVAEAIEHLDEAAGKLDGCHHLTYEELTTIPQRFLNNVCGYLGVPFESHMLNYGNYQHGPFLYGIGDWSERIQSGQVQPAETVPEPTNPQVRELCRRWGYLSDTTGSENVTGRHLLEEAA